MKKTVSKIAKGKRARASVWLGGKEKTSGGLKKSDIVNSKSSGKLVSKKSSAAGKKAYKNIQGWTVAVQKAKKELGLKGFVAVKKGSALYNKAKASHTK